MQAGRREPGITLKLGVGVAGVAGAGVVDSSMARRLRIQYPGARYHVINRGNLQHDVFATFGAQNAFLIALEQAAVQFGWQAHAFVVLRNHYHFALETPEPNLVDGMHWLQSTFATKLTRFHDQHGHVFQGRYKALLVEDAHHLARVCDYIPLNPVAAPYRWIATTLRMGHPAAVRGYLSARTLQSAD